MVKIEPAIDRLQEALDPFSADPDQPSDAHSRQPPGGDVAVSPR
jgi:hypothetical protein